MITDDGQKPISKKKKLWATVQNNKNLQPGYIKEKIIIRSTFEVKEKKRVNTIFRVII